MARIANKYLDWNISYALLFFDLIVVFSSYFIIGAEKMMFTIVMLYIGTKVMDFIIEGLNTKKAVTIISEHKHEIAEQVNTLMDRGVTLLSGKGNYTGQSKEILYIVIQKQELSMLKKSLKAVIQKRLSLFMMCVMSLVKASSISLNKRIPLLKRGGFFLCLSRSGYDSFPGNSLKAVS